MQRYDADASEFAREFMFNSVRTHQLNRMAVPAYAQRHRRAEGLPNSGNGLRLAKEQWRLQVLANRESLRPMLEQPTR